MTEGVPCNGNFKEMQLNKDWKRNKNLMLRGELFVDTKRVKLKYNATEKMSKEEGSLKVGQDEIRPPVP